MNNKNRSKFVKSVIPLIIIAGIFALNAVETRSTSDNDRNDIDMSYLLDCGYIRSNVANTIFHPNFVAFLSKRLNRYKLLNEHHVENAVKIWNGNIQDKRKIIHYQQDHFIRMATLSTTMDACEGDECMITEESLALLRHWMSDIMINVDQPAAIKPVTPAELKRFNIDNDNNIDEALKEIIKIPVGKQLLAYAIDNNVSIRSKHLHNRKGYFDCKHRSIIIDPTVSSYIFKLNCIIHELVHATNFDNDNSIIEETIAEIIGMQVQDNITDINIACSPYIVFIDRVLDPDYGNLPVSNNIYKYLMQAGIAVHIVNEERK